mmetsp:Transcript_22180/g.31054  ORF Transcript_22180/g.31054 Transcript_22180/m.31054 type:complete len:178 (+) Transcript_22180:1125-1658(+)
MKIQWQQSSTKIQIKIPPTIISAWEAEPIRLIDAITNDLFFISSEYPSIETDVKSYYVSMINCNFKEQVQVNTVSLVQKLKNKLNSVATKIMDTRNLQMASDTSNIDIGSNKDFACLYIEDLRKAFVNAKLKHWFTTYSSWDQLYSDLVRVCYSEVVLIPRIMKGMEETSLSTLRNN